MMQRWRHAPPLPVVVLGISVIFLFTRFFRLTALPVFADEAIYIRWAQLILHEPSRYAFFSLNDGKPPFFIWMLLPFVRAFSDPLWAARAVSAMIGLAQLFINDALIRTLGGKNIARVAAATITLLAPFWFFHHRMGLFDATLTLWLSLSFLGLLLLPSHRVLGMALSALGWGLALWTKTPALFFAPIFVLLAVVGPWFFSEKKWEWKKVRWLERFMWFGLSGAVGLGIFFILRLHPAFGSLFVRSGDFTFTTTELLGGNWRTSVDNGVRLLRWLSAYLRPEIISTIGIALIVSKKNKLHLLLVLTALIFAAPLLLYGKTLHPRYFLPMAAFLTISAALFTEEAALLVSKAKDNFFQIIFVLLIGFFFIGSLRFLLLSFFTPNQTPFVLHDREQYLTEWSSGHGIRETRNLLLERARRGERTTVVTEGSFGTLPDALLLYFDKAPEIQYLRIEGLGQYPVKYLPEWVKDEAKNNETWLVVNEHRMEVPEDQVELLARFERPYGAPELRIYKVKVLK